MSSLARENRPASVAGRFSGSYHRAELSTFNADASGSFLHNAPHAGARLRFEGVGTRAGPRHRADMARPTRQYRVIVTSNGPPFAEPTCARPCFTPRWAWNAPVPSQALTGPAHLRLGTLIAWICALGPGPPSLPGMAAGRVRAPDRKSLPDAFFPEGVGFFARTTAPVRRANCRTRPAPTLPHP